jgi:glycosyltransferase involved in cell wall biosynthesis
MLSFVIPAYNEEFELPATLAAIRDAAQDRQYEIIVVDDASTDRTVEIAKDAGALVVPINRRQIAAARNAGAHAARGEVFFFVDADTRIRKEHVDLALDALTNGFSGGGALIQTDRDVPLWGRVFLKIFCAAYFAGKLAAGAFLFTSRENFEKVGRFDERYFAGEEVWLSLALKKIGPFTILPAPVVTSGRKLRMHSAWHIWSRAFAMILGGLRTYGTRDRLDLWYDGKRETAARSPAFARLRRGKHEKDRHLHCASADAHRFYFLKRMSISSYHFRIKTSP